MSCDPIVSWFLLGMLFGLAWWGATGLVRWLLKGEGEEGR